MKKTVLTLLILAGSFRLSAQFEDLRFGTDSTLEIVSWNIEHFPKNGQATLEYVADIIEALDVDVVAIQEVTSEARLNQLADALDGWDGYYAYNQYAALAYVYKTDVIKDADIYQIYKPNNREFPREPLVMEMNFEGEHFVIINNHLKCCGDGYLDHNDDWDEEKRRLDACQLIDQYIVDNHPDDRLIFLGDLNDVLTDIPSNNVFSVFIDNANDYLFADMDIAEGNSSDWSYPSWPSHIDHILITSELFDEFGNPGSAIQTLKPDEYFDGGFSEYDYNVSDHRPVGLKLKVNSGLGEIENQISNFQLNNFPNPFRNKTTITFEAAPPHTQIKIINMQGQIMLQASLKKGQSSFVWKTEQSQAGIYSAQIITDNQVVARRKIVLLK
jgi:endonuclease/exonuclease/phosphatase family metal-dependent hydrolase